MVGHGGGAAEVALMRRGKEGDDLLLAVAGGRFDGRGGVVAAALRADLGDRHNWTRICLAGEERGSLLARGGGGGGHAAELCLTDPGVGLGTQPLELGFLLEAQQALFVALAQGGERAAGLGWLDERPEEAPERRGDGGKDHSQRHLRLAKLREELVGEF